MEQTKKPKRSVWKRLYVNVLLLILPLLLLVGSKVSKKIKSETEYIGNDFIFALDIAGFGRGCVVKQVNNSWKRLPKNTEKVDFAIGFRDLDYAYDVFIGNLALKKAFSARLFSTSGPNNKGVAITYMFLVILKTFFGWRKTYRQ